MFKKTGLALALALGVVIAAPVAQARDYPVTMTYVAPAAPQMAPSITLSVVDARTNGPNWLGAIRGGYGNPLKVLVTEAPVSEVVAQALHDGLAARNLAAESGPHRLVIRLERFDCNQFFPKEAYFVAGVRLEDAQTNALLYETSIRAAQAGPGFGTGIFTPIEPLRALANEVLQRGVDQTLDDPGLRAALAAAPAVSATPPVEATTPAAEAEPAPTP